MNINWKTITTQVRISWRRLNHRLRRALYGVVIIIDVGFVTLEWFDRLGLPLLSA